ncbi:MAG: DUF481 domain-containing protein [Pseudomonadota bacterium]
MKRLLKSASALTAAFACAAVGHARAAAAEAPPGIAKELIEVAAESGDVDRVRIVSEELTKVLPSFQAEIEAYAQTMAKIMTASAAAATGEQPVVVTESAAEPTQAVETAAAAPAAEPPEDKSGGFFAGWTGDANFGASFASGNSDNVAIGGAFEAKRQQGKLLHDFRGYFDIGEADGVVNQRRWGASYKLDVALGDRSYAFTRFAYDEDEFSGFDYRLFAGAGAGYFLAKSEPFTLKVEGGPGYRYSPIDDTRDIDEEIAIYGGLDLDWVIREGLKFEQDVAVTWTDPTTTTESTTSLAATIAGGVTAGVAFSYRFETNPPAGRLREDTVLRATLGYDF